MYSFYSLLSLIYAIVCTCYVPILGCVQVFDEEAAHHGDASAVVSRAARASISLSERAGLLARTIVSKGSKIFRHNESGGPGLARGSSVTSSAGGYAFSQEERGAVRQADLVKMYGTPPVEEEGESVGGGARAAAAAAADFNASSLARM